MADQKVFQIGCIGAGGWARSLLHSFAAHVPPQRGRIAAVVALPAEAAEQEDFLRSHGIRIVASPDELLGIDELDGVIVPTSIDTHWRYTAQALAAGKHVYCEKPVTATIQDARAMIEARDRAGKCVAVGYQSTASASAQWAKQLIAGGHIGPVRRAKVRATWPRPQSYYDRNTWAGTIRTDNGWTLDSPAGNALAHQLDMLLWLTGPDATASNRVTRVEAELYRAYDIENYDTCALRAQTLSGCELLILLTHACRISRNPTLLFEGEASEVHRDHPDRSRLVRGGQIVQEVVDDRDSLYARVFGAWLDRMAGLADRLPCEIENALETTRLICAASACSPIATFPPGLVHTYRKDADVFRAVDGIEDVLQTCYETFQLPSETGRADWAAPARCLDTTDFEHFAGPFGQ